MVIATSWPYSEYEYNSEIVLDLSYNSLGQSDLVA
jgi:hypothetical protein